MENNRRKQQQPKKKKSSINRLATSVQNNIQKLYKNTYFTEPENYNDLNNIKTSIDTNIDNIISNNMDSVGIPNISKLYSRIQMKDGKDTSKDGTMREIETLFNDPTVTDGILSSYAQNKYIKELDEEIDLICKYMPQLEDALDAKKDNVLAADHFSKDFINVENKTNIDQDVTFLERIDELKATYNLLELFETIYDKTAHYGEQFIYIVPYKKVLGKLMDAKAGHSNGAIITNETARLANNGIIRSCIDGVNRTIVTEGVKGAEPITPTEIGGGTEGKLNVELNISGVLESAINEYKSVSNIYRNKNTSNSKLS